MERVIVTVKIEGGGEAVDMELPADLPAEALAQLLCPDAGPAELEAFPPGRVLEPGESLAAAGAWHGAWLLVRPKTG